MVSSYAGLFSVSIFFLIVFFIAILHLARCTNGFVGYLRPGWWEGTTPSALWLVDFLFRHVLRRRLSVALRFLIQYVTDFSGLRFFM